MRQKFLLVAATALVISGCGSPSDDEDVAKKNVNFSSAESIDAAFVSEGISACGFNADDYLRSIAKHDFKWDDDAKGFLHEKFGSFRKSVASYGVITYISDKAKLQNGFGAFNPITLYCDYESRQKKVLKYYSDVAPD